MLPFVRCLFYIDNRSQWFFSGSLFSPNRSQELRRLDGDATFPVAFSLYSQEGKMISFRIVHSGIISVWGWWMLSLFALAQTPAPQLLTPGTSSEREIAGGQVHSYQVQLAAGQYLQLRYEKCGADVQVELTPPDGQKAMVFDLTSGERGSEEIGYLANSGGMYQLIVRPRWQDAPPGKYELRCEAIRAATEQDRALVEAFSLSSEMANLAGQGKYDEALVIAARRVALCQQWLPAAHPQLAAALNDQAVYANQKGDRKRAEELYQQALALLEQAPVTDPLKLANLLTNLALLYDQKAEHKQAEPLYQRALTLLEQAHGATSLYLANTLGNFAQHYKAQSDYVRAEPLYKRELAIRERYGAAANLHGALNNFAGLYAAKGDYVQAKQLYQRVLTMLEQQLGAAHPELALPLNNLAQAYRNSGEDEQAEPLLKRSLELREKAFGPVHPHVANSLNNLGSLYKDKGDYAQAEPLLKRALTILEKLYGPDHPNVSFPLNNLAQLYYLRGKLPQAEESLRRVLTIRERAFGPQHPQLANLFRGFARLYQAKGDLAQATLFQQRTSDITEYNLTRNLVIGSERQKLAYLEMFAEQSNEMLALHLHTAPAERQAAQLAFSVLLRHKGRTLEAMSDTIAPLRRRASEQDKALFDQLSAARSQLAGLLLSGPGRGGPAAYQAQISQLKQQLEQHETELSTRSDAFRAQVQPITLEAVQAAIPAQTALVEFTLWSPVDNQGRPQDRAHYAAYVLTRDGALRWADLGAAAPLEVAIANLRAALRDPQRTDTRKLARAVDERLMRPLRNLLGDASHVLLAPDGQLNLLPFAALVDERGRYLVERFQFTYLTSGRDLLRLPSNSPSETTAAVVVADPAFGERVNEAAATTRDIKPVYGAQPAGALPLLAQVYFRPLPGTAGEAKALQAILPNATVLTGQQATEAALRQLHRPRLLHIATHGFFLNDGFVQRQNATAPAGAPQRSAASEIQPSASPLLRSGLALAGANPRRSGEDDGVLTALEASALDLWGTQLVVLSACDTGVGEVRNGEGVYGLRRALVLAGAESQLMSLWPIADLSTRDLMQDYYQRLLNGAGRGAALRQVQLQMLKRKPRQHPYYWASFIQSGAWSGLTSK
jgi:CHAT domain-containing protein